MPEPSGPGASRGRAARSAPFGFVQLEFGRLLGPPDGNFLVRDEAGAAPLALLLLATLGAPQRRRLRDRRARPVERPTPEPVPTARATVVRPEPFASDAAAREWLELLRRDRRRAEAELGAAARIVNRALHAFRVAAADPYATDVSPAQALVARAGVGSGDELAGAATGTFFELPRPAARGARRWMDAPTERFAAILGGRERALPAEELVLRARLDLDAGRLREAALGALAALDGLLGPPAMTLADRPALEAAREPLAAAAGAAAAEALAAPARTAVADGVARMEAALRRRWLGR